MRLNNLLSSPDKKAAENLIIMKMKQEMKCDQDKQTEKIPQGLLNDFESVLWLLSYFHQVVCLQISRYQLSTSKFCTCTSLKKCLECFIEFFFIFIYTVSLWRWLWSFLPGLTREGDLTQVRDQEDTFPSFLFRTLTEPSTNAQNL